MNWLFSSKPSYVSINWQSKFATRTGSTHLTTMRSTNCNMARVVIDTRPIRDLKGDSILRGSAYERLLEARERKPDVPVIPDRTADFVFIRYIGHPEMNYNSVFLDEWANYLVSQLQEGANAYIFCHSLDNMIAPYPCRELHRRVADEIPIKQLPWDDADSTTLQQGRLF